MIQLLATNDPVLLSFVTCHLSAAGVDNLVLDAHMSALEGSIGAIPRRIMVADEDRAQARRLVTDWGLGHVLGR